MHDLILEIAILSCTVRYRVLHVIKIEEFFLSLPGTVLQLKNIDLQFLRELFCSCVTDLNLQKQWPFKVLQK